MEGNHINRLRALLQAYMDNNISEFEFDELIQLIQATEDEVLASAIPERWNESGQDTSAILNSDRIYYQILADPRVASGTFPTKKGRIQSLRPFIAGAAALICMGIFLYVQQTSTSKKTTPHNIAVNSSKPIIPGSKKAILTLTGGEQIVLDTVSEKTLSLHLGTTVKKERGKLLYINDSSFIHGEGQPQQNTISTPRGSEFELMLPDGTHVWLNAGTSLTYPTRFGKDQRKVQLLGEAYFDVAKGKNQPFVVEAKGTQIKVLGTQFNVSAYQEEVSIKTTLVTGSLLVKSEKLNPGQQAITFPRSESIKIHTVDIAEATAWRRGYFFFADEELTTVMNTLARWYNIEVTYSGNLQGKTFGGTISRYEDFHRLLKAIELTGSVHFQVKERRVMVSP